MNPFHLSQSTLLLMMSLGLTLPVAIVALIGVVLGIILVRRSRSAGMLLFIGCLVLFAALVMELGWSRFAPGLAAQGGWEVITLVSWGFEIVLGVGLGLAIAGVFAGRRASPPAPPRPPTQGHPQSPYGPSAGRYGPPPGQYPPPGGQYPPPGGQYPPPGGQYPPPGGQYPPPGGQYPPPGGPQPPPGGYPPPQR